MHPVEIPLFFVCWQLLAPFLTFMEKSSSTCTPPQWLREKVQASFSLMQFQQFLMKSHMPKRVSKDGTACRESPDYRGDGSADGYTSACFPLTRGTYGIWLLHHKPMSFPAVQAKGQVGKSPESNVRTTHTLLAGCRWPEVQIV